MRKIEFMEKCESWLVDNDIIEPDYRMSYNTMKNRNVNQYIHSVTGMLNDKAPDLLPTFKQMVKQSRVRGIER